MNSKTNTIIIYESYILYHKCIDNYIIRNNIDNRMDINLYHHHLFDMIDNQTLIYFQFFLFINIPTFFCLSSYLLLLWLPLFILLFWLYFLFLIGESICFILLFFLFLLLYLLKNIFNIILILWFTIFHSDIEYKHKHITTHIPPY